MGQIMPNRIAILCSGQGGQHAAMFDLVANCPEAEPVFSTAAEVRGQDPRRFVREAAPADPFSNRSGQILCCIQALAMQAALGTVWPAPTVIAGYTLANSRPGDAPAPSMDRPFCASRNAARQPWMRLPASRAAGRRARWRLWNSVPGPH